MSAASGLSRIAALGCAFLPTASRSIVRRSSASASKQPAANQRWACWYTAVHGGRSFGIQRQGAPVFNT